MQHRRAVAIAAAASMLTACQVGPNFTSPPAPSATGYVSGSLPTAIAPTAPGAPAQRLIVGADVPGRWWQAYRSAELDDLVEQAIKASPEIESAEAALRGAHELYLAQRGALQPTVDAGYNVSRQQLSREISPTLNNNAELFTLHTLQVNVGYTPDVFGGLHRQAENAQAQAEAQRFQAEATYLTLTTNVVAAAIQQASLAAQIRDAEALVASNRRTLEMLQRSSKLGELSETEVAAQEVAVAQAEQGLPALRKQLAQQNDLIAFLTGRTPGEASVAILDLDTLVLPADLPVSLPSELVKHRPDVRAAEANLHAASAAVGVAVAARLPTFPLTASAGSQASDFGVLFSGPNAFWTLTGGVAAPIFQGGQLRHRERNAVALLDQAKAQYRGAVLTAFQNVADSLHALDGDARALDAASAVDVASGRALASAQKQLNAGEGAALPVLQAEQARLQSHSAVTQARAQRLADTVALYQALGGGWWNRTDFADAKAPGAPARP